MEEEMRTMCNLSEGIAEEAWEQGAGSKTIEVIKNLWRAGKDMSIIKIASGWDEEQIMQVLKSEMN